MKSLGALSAIALNTFRETVRDRVLYAIVFFALVATMAGLVLGTLSVEQDVRILADLGLFTITVFGGLIAIFVGTNLVFKEIDRRTIFLIFTKPIEKWEFVTGKFLGLALCIMVVCFAMGLFLIGVAWLQIGDPSIIPRLVSSLGLIYVELVLVIALATFFSTFATPLMSMLFTLGIWICCHMSDSLSELGKLSSSPLVKGVSAALFYVLPDLARLTRIRGEMLDGGIFPAATTLIICLYIALYTVLLLSFATEIAERREFQ
jgi:Cu-processing system permease protein